MNEPGLITRSYHRYIKLELSKIDELLKKINSNKNIHEYKKFSQSFDENFINKFYKDICEENNFINTHFGIVVKRDNQINTYVYSENNKTQINDYTFIHENFIKHNLQQDFEENIMFETDLNEIKNKLLSKDNLIVLMMRPIPMDSFLSAVNSGDRLPPKVTNFLPKPPAGLVFQSLEGNI
tara:strand:- start:1093 stop:1635 length:543 start_codon:yes stop_codon:yes gene_type:complete